MFNTNLTVSPASKRNAQRPDVAGRSKSGQRLMSRLARQDAQAAIKRRLEELAMLWELIENYKPLPDGFVGRVEGNLVFVTRPDGTLVDPFVHPGIAA